jgi:hypothetical protein
VHRAVLGRNRSAREADAPNLVGVPLSDLDVIAKNACGEARVEPASCQPQPERFGPGPLPHVSPRDRSAPYPSDAALICPVRSRRRGQTVNRRGSFGAHSHIGIAEAMAAVWEPDFHDASRRDDRDALVHFNDDFAERPKLKMVEG